jgi:non-ribosomal peptide synthetase component F
MNDAPKKTAPAVRQQPATIPGRFTQVVSRFPNRVAVSTPNTHWTYSELDDYSGVLACEIIDRVGVVSEPVALLMEHAAPLIAAILGVLRAGKIYLALDPTDLAARLAAMLGHAHARLLLTDKANVSLAHSLAAGRLQVMEIDDHLATHSESTI